MFNFNTIGRKFILNLECNDWTTFCILQETRTKKWIHVVHNKEQTVDRTYIHCTVHGKKKVKYCFSIWCQFKNNICCCVSFVHMFLGQILGTYIVACTVFKEGILPVDPGYDVSG